MRSINIKPSDILRDRSNQNYAVKVGRVSINGFAKMTMVAIAIDQTTHELTESFFQCLHDFRVNKWTDITTECCDLSYQA